jgi:hypothetical protein
MGQRESMITNIRLNLYFADPMDAGSDKTVEFGGDRHGK